MSILEAMALERPVVATNVGGNGEAVLDGETGHLVAPGDLLGARALLALARDRVRTREMGLAGRRRQLERFSGESMVDGYLRAPSRSPNARSPGARARAAEGGAWPGLRRAG